MGVAMQDPHSTVNLAARYEPERAGALSGFDPATKAGRCWGCTIRTATRCGCTPLKSTSTVRRRGEL